MKQTYSIQNILSVLAVLAGAVIFSTGADAAFASRNSGEVVDVKSRGEIVRILVEKSEAYLDFEKDPPRPWLPRPFVEPKIVGAVILFAGGSGVLEISEMGSMRYLSGNFLVRSKTYFQEKGFVTVIIAGPTDVPGDLYGFRGTENHAKDVAAVIAYLRKKFDVPVWMVGHSRGTNSVANAAVKLQGPKGPDGIVLTATMLEYSSNGDMVLEYSLSEIRIPVVIAHHRLDACSLTPPGNVDDLEDALKNAKILGVFCYEGGSPKGNDCQSNHYHGFRGIES